VANTGSFERNMFWISVSRSRERLPLEPLLEVIHPPEPSRTHDSPSH
jgi:hypothetical protein